MKILLFKDKCLEPFRKYDDPKQVKICANDRIVRIYNHPEGTLEKEYRLVSKKLNWVKILDEKEILVTLNVKKESLSN
ncbi:hypothetical protein [Nitrosopumilus sp.]|uniref:hypothetical protein n=1 Tax=Nitrosopumilus sp. TaxID=2024843 RepID=UPI00293160F9|nr:hypothetical protein [Nitrosopumilus sp.]